jgi:hypothetical protein
VSFHIQKCIRETLKIQENVILKITVYYKVMNKQTDEEVFIG